MLWHELKWTEIEAIDKDLPVVIPLGSVEQHGHHLPLFTDTIQVAAISDAVEKKLGDEILMLPVLWLGSSHHHLNFPGTISIRPSLYTQVISDLATSILKAGFRRLFFLNGHGGNEIPAGQALSEISATNDLATSSLLAFASWWAVGKPNPAQLGMSTPAISHACEYETSLVAYLRGDLTDLKRAHNIVEPIDSSWLTGQKRVVLFRRFDQLTNTGNLGQPKASSADKGRRIVDSVVSDIVTFVREFAHWPIPRNLKPREASP